MRNSLACTVAASVIAWVGFWTVLPSGAAEPNEVTKWEYLVVDEDGLKRGGEYGFTAPIDREILNLSGPVGKSLCYVGLQGWELVTVVPERNTLIYYFKRPAGSRKGLPEELRNHR
jgi:hypothetical protein